MKVFHDDNRFPPDDTWEWAQSNDACIALLEQGGVQVVSLDMDLGAVEGKDFNYGRPLGWLYRGQTCRSVDWLRNMNNDPGENGLDLIKAMIEKALIPPRIIIHTWNGWGGRAMIQALKDAGYTHAESIMWNGTLAHQQQVYSACPVPSE